MIVCLLGFLPPASDKNIYQFSASEGYTSEAILCDHNCFWRIEMLDIIRQWIQ